MAGRKSKSEIVGSEPVLSAEDLIALEAIETAKIVDPEPQFDPSLTPEDIIALSTPADEIAIDPTDLDTPETPFGASEPIEGWDKVETSVEEPTNEPQKFDDVLKAQANEAIATMVAALKTELSDRRVFETDKNPSNDNIHRTLKKCEREMTRDAAARCLLAANTDASFINRHLGDGSRYNVYAISKVSDLIDGLVGIGLHNAINIAVCRSLFAFEKAGLPFTSETARAAASDKIRVDGIAKLHLVRHTVAASTAPTQASSSMQALQTLGIVRIEGSTKHPTYRVMDTPQAHKLREVCAAMAA